MFWPILTSLRDLRKKLALSLIALAVLVALALSARAWLASAAKAESPVPGAVSAEQPTVTTAPKVRIDGELVTIRPSGFEPKRFTRAAGPFILMVENRSGLQSIRLRMNPATDAVQLTLPPLFDVTVPHEQLDWSGLQNLAPGDYALTETNHPGWVCHLTITAQ